MVDDDGAYAYVAAAGEVVAAVLDLLLVVGQVLEVVGVERALGELDVGLHVVVEGLDLEVELGVWRQLLVDVLEDLGVRVGEAPTVILVTPELSGAGPSASPFVRPQAVRPRAETVMRVTARAVVRAVDMSSSRWWPVGRGLQGRAKGVESASVEAAGDEFTLLVKEAC